MTTVEILKEMAFTATESQRRALEDAISALSTEGDLISRQAVLDELEKWDWQDLYLPIHFKQILDDIPSVENRGEWIPVTEKLPKDHEEVLIYLSTNRITIGLYNSHVLPLAPYKPIGWGVNAQTAVHNFCSDDVVAWMPLPNPWKGE